MVELKASSESVIIYIADTDSFARISGGVKLVFGFVNLLFRKFIVGQFNLIYTLILYNLFK
jgi:hypothetical protein